MQYQDISLLQPIYHDLYVQNKEVQYQDISIVPDVALPYSGHTDHDKSVEGVSLRTNMNNSTSEPVSSSTTLQEMGSKARESKVTNTDALRFE